jgi:uncharacterized protein (DUF2141 family)
MNPAVSGHTPRSGLWARHAAVFGLALACLTETSSSHAEEGSSLNVVEFRMRLREKGGVVRCGLFERSGWLKKTVAADIARARASGATALCVFHKVRPGTYGLSAFHDQNENGKLDTNFLGMPIEDYCASNNARGVLGPPSFENAKFSYTGGTKRLEANLK